MKIPLWLPCLASLLPACATAQVTVNTAALRQLEGLPAPAPTVIAKPAVARPPVHKARVMHYHHPKPEIAPAAPAKPPAPPAPKAAPKPAPPPTPAKPVALPVARIEFAPGSAALPAGAASVLKPFCAAHTQVPVITRAAADPTDPSGAMRLSLNRAFAIRDALTACGVPAQNIIPRAAGNVPGADENEALIGASAPP